MGRRFVYRAFRTYGMFETLSSTRGESLRGARARHTGRDVVLERGAGSNRKNKHSCRWARKGLRPLAAHDQRTHTT